MERKEPQRRPYLIITNGPTGSGKSGLVNKTIDHFKIPPNHHTFLIDDLIESNKEYKHRIDALIINECGSHSLCPSLVKRLNNPDSDFYEKFGAMYFDVRGKNRWGILQNKKWG